MVGLLASAWAGAMCDAVALEVAFAALGPVEEAAVARITAADALDACAFPSELAEVLEAVAAGRDADALDAELSTRLPGLWAETCPGGRGGRDKLWSRCELAGWGVFTEVEWLAGQGPPVASLLAFTAARAGGLSDALAQVLVRRLAGVPARAVPAVVREFEPLFPTFP